MLALALVALASGNNCKITQQPWLLNNTHRGNTLQGMLLIATDLGSGAFNMSAWNPHAYGGKNQRMNSDPWQGTVVGNKIHLKISAGSLGKGRGFVAQDCSGTFSESCTRYHKHTQKHCHPSHLSFQQHRLGRGRMLSYQRENRRIWVVRRVDSRMRLACSSIRRRHELLGRFF